MAQVPGAVDVGLSTRGQKPELEVALDRGLAGAVGVSVGQVAQTLRVAFAGLDAGDWIDPSGETRDVYVRLSPEARQRVSDLAALPLFVNGPDGRGVAVPLGQVARITTGVGPGAHRPPRSRADDCRRGQHAGPRADRSAEGHQHARRPPR